MLPAVVVRLPTGIVLTYVPTAAALTTKEKVQPPAGTRLPALKVAVLAPMVAVTVLPADRQLPCNDGVAATTIPAGKLSVNVLFR